MTKSKHMDQRLLITFMDNSVKKLRIANDPIVEDGCLKALSADLTTAQAWPLTAIKEYWHNDWHPEHVKFSLATKMDDSQFQPPKEEKNGKDNS